jgi:PBP1b-binding outer membrane lipoprotein LpoB
MKKIILLSLLSLILFVISASAQTQVKVNFGKNRSEKTLSGLVKGTNYIEYVFRVNRYEFIDVTLKSGNPKLWFSIFDNKGIPVEQGDMVKTFSGEAEKTQNYTVRVYDSSKRRGSTRFRITISAFMGT